MTGNCALQSDVEYDKQGEVKTEPDVVGFASCTKGKPVSTEVNPGGASGHDRTSTNRNVTSTDERQRTAPRAPVSFMSILCGLSWLDRLLPFFVVAAMIIGVVLGEFVPNIKERLTQQATLLSVPAPLTVGLIIMMWPILTKVQFELLPVLLQSRKLWTQIGVSLVLNWVIGPFVMLGLAWATLPDLPAYRTGVILVGAARCIAMVMIWVAIARGDCNICACIVVVNAVLQIVAYAPLCLLLINVISDGDSLQLQYGKTALSVLVFLGIPLVSGIATRFPLIKILGRKRFEERFMPFFAPLSLLALLYVIIVIFASQARQILDNLGPVFRTMVPLVVYFALMWTLTFAAVWRLSLRDVHRRSPLTESHDDDAAAAAELPKRTSLNDGTLSGSEFGSGGEKQADGADGAVAGAHASPRPPRPAMWGYEMAVVQSFTGASNNFELAIAIAVAAYGADSEETLGATIGPLVEVPVLLLLSYVALWLGHRLRWGERYETSGQEGAAAAAARLA